MIPLLCALLQATVEEATVPVTPLSGTLGVWRASSSKSESASRTFRVGPADLLGAPDGAPCRFETEGPLRVQLRGIRLAADKGLSLKRDGARMVLRLLKGTVVVESYASEVELETPAGRVAGKDVVFLATADEKSTRVLALEGSVTFTSDLGPPAIAVPVGSGLDAERGKAPAPPKPVPAGERDGAWPEDLNLLKNGGFESQLEGWGSTDGLDVQGDVKIVRSGRRSLRVTLKDWRANDPILPARLAKGVLRPGAVYLFRFYVRTEGYADPSGPAVFKLGLDPGGKDARSATSLHVELKASEGAWSARRVSFTATSTDLWFGCFAATAGGPFQGTFWFDDFQLTELAPPDQAGRRR